MAVQMGIVDAWNTKVDGEGKRAMERQIGKKYVLEIFQIEGRKVHWYS